ncbi:MAG: dTMP kinase [candidate division Zixibacteria bacterium RBG_16_50_21]|nr:MAG: dTMP kinase [candidate division Zixibacteria bacterium RBG_16_50_21]
MQGKLITLEGIDYSGKSTQAGKLYHYLRSRKLPAILIREPGGTRISEKIREVLLSSRNHSLVSEAELLLYQAARAQLVSRVILPALRQGKIVVCDRFYDSTTAYQGYARGLDLNLIEKLNKFASSRIVPDLTILIDTPVEIALKRVRKAGKLQDRLESERLNFHKKVRNGYLAIAKGHPGRVKIIKGDQSIEKIWQKLKSTVDKFLKPR